MDTRLAPDYRLGPWEPVHPYTSVIHLRTESRQMQAGAHGAKVLSMAEAGVARSSRGLGMADTRWRVITHMVEYEWDGGRYSLEDFESIIDIVEPNSRYMVTFELGARTGMTNDRRMRT